MRHRQRHRARPSHPNQPANLPRSFSACTTFRPLFSRWTSSWARTKHERSGTGFAGLRMSRNGIISRALWLGKSSGRVLCLAAGNSGSSVPGADWKMEGRCSLRVRCRMMTFRRVPGTWCALTNSSPRTMCFRKPRSAGQTNLLTRPFSAPQSGPRPSPTTAKTSTGKNLRAPRRPRRCLRVARWSPWRRST